MDHYLHLRPIVRNCRANQFAGHTTQPSIASRNDWSHPERDGCSTSGIICLYQQHIQAARELLTHNGCTAHGDSRHAVSERRKVGLVYSLDLTALPYHPADKQPGWVWLAGRFCFISPSPGKSVLTISKVFPKGTYLDRTATSINLC